MRTASGRSRMKAPAHFRGFLRSADVFTIYCARRRIDGISAVNSGLRTWTPGNASVSSLSSWSRTIACPRTAIECGRKQQQPHHHQQVDPRSRNRPGARNYLWCRVQSRRHTIGGWLWERGSGRQRLTRQQVSSPGVRHPLLESHRQEMGRSTHPGTESTVSSLVHTGRSSPGNRHVTRGR
jgi:hypothetical protein